MYIIYVRNLYMSHSLQKMWNDIHHLYGVFSYVHVNISCFGTSFHMWHIYTYLAHNKSACDNHNFFQNETLSHTCHNAIPENMLHVMNMMNIRIYTKSWFDHNNHHHNHNHHKNYHKIKPSNKQLCQKHWYTTDVTNLCWYIWWFYKHNMCSNY